MPIKAYLSANKAGFSFIVLFWLIFFSRTIFGGQVYFLDDLKIIYYPLEVVYAQAQHAWQLPVWNNYFGFGQPILAWSQLGFFTPLHVFLRLFYLHPLTLLQVSVISYFLIGLTGAYAWFRRYTLSQSAAATGAILLLFNGFYIGHLNHVNFYTSTTLLPWLFICIDLFLAKPTIKRSAFLTLCAGAIAISGQAQIVLYSLVIGALYGIIKAFSLWRSSWLTITKVGIYTLLSVILFLGLASFSLLPLREFLPITERGEGVPVEELYEFSYPAYHAITLILPYFYGDHAFYWGAKGFQELAAFIGILPLFLLGAGVSVWRDRRALRVFALLLIVMGITLALGKNSAVYTYLVENHILTTIGVAGRFVFFFTTGVAILAALGLDSLLTWSQQKTRVERLVLVSSSLLIPFVLLLPFFLHLSDSIRDWNTLYSLASDTSGSWLMVKIGFITFLVLYAASLATYHVRLVQWVATFVIASTLLVYGWNYNPLLHTSIAFQEIPLQTDLKKIASSGAFPRLYSRPTIYTNSPDQKMLPTDKVSRVFTIYQPITFTGEKNSCLRFPIYTDARQTGAPIRVSLHASIGSEPLEEAFIVPSDSPSGGETSTHICWHTIDQLRERSGVLSFKSAASNINLYYQNSTDSKDVVYFVRKTEAEQTPDIIDRSAKHARLLWQEEAGTFDSEAFSLARHLNILSETSSARWIGALSIRSYREFIETFFANDNDQMLDGDNRHFLQNNRRLLDFAGVTHLAQYVGSSDDDQLSRLGFNIEKEYQIEDKRLRLYSNPNAFPKTFMVRNASFLAAADEVRYNLLQPDYDPSQIIYISGTAKPGDLPIFNSEKLISKTEILSYTPTRVDIQVTTNNEGWLVLTDSTTPEWKTYIDDQPTLYFIANSIFKTARVPTGTHIVSFRYNSDSIELSKKLSTASLIVLVLLLIIPSSWLYRKQTPVSLTL